jgi:tetratricopeptide (TPR) repeat protein
MKVLRDTWLTFQYEVGQLVHNPVNIAVTLMQPITYLAFFTPFLKSVMRVSTYGAAYQVYVPSLFVAMGLFNGMFGGFTLLAAMRKGVEAYAAGRRPEAAHEFDVAIERDPSKAQPHIYAGRIYREDGNLQSAAIEFRKAIELEPQNALALREM